MAVVSRDWKCYRLNGWANVVDGGLTLGHFWKTSGIYLSCFQNQLDAEHLLTAAIFRASLIKKDGLTREDGRRER